MKSIGDFIMSVCIEIKEKKLSKAMWKHTSVDDTCGNYGI